MSGGLTNDIDESQELTEKVSVSPPVVMFEVVREVVEQQALLLTFFYILRVE